MIRIAVRVHHLGLYHSATSPNRVDGSRIARLYEPAGVNLRFLSGQNIPGDPATGEGYGYWVARLSDDRSADGMVLCHLILGWEPPSEATGDKGRLLDIEHRGVAAVFTRDPYFGVDIGYGDDAVTQTAAHEIGHLLNLVHPPIYPSSPLVGTMHQHTVGRTSIRRGSRRHGWPPPRKRSRACRNTRLQATIRLRTCIRWSALADAGSQPRRRPTFSPGDRASAGRAHRTARHSSANATAGPSVACEVPMSNKRAARVLSRVLAFAAMLTLGGCLVSTYEATKLNTAGDLGDAQGVPYTLPRAEFIPKPVDGKPGQYELVTTQVPDPDQRYSLRTAPAWFADVTFDMKLGDSGSLTEVGATQTERVVSTITAVGSFAVSALSAAALFADRGSLASDLQSAIGTLAAPECLSDAKAGLDGRLARYAPPTPDDNALRAEFYYADQNEKKCLEAVRVNLAKYDELVSETERTAFREAYKTLANDSNLTADDRLFLTKIDQILTLLLPKDRDKLRDTIADALKAIPNDGYNNLVKILNLPEKPYLDEDRLLRWSSVISTLKDSLLQGKQEQVLEIFVTQMIEMPPEVWRARRIKDLDRKIDAATLAALIDDEDLEQTLQPLREEQARVADQHVAYVRLRAIEHFLDRLPPHDASAKSSAFEEYARARAEAELLRTQISAAIEVLAAKAKPPVKAEPELGPAPVPRVSPEVIKTLTPETPGWEKLPPLLVVLRPIPAVPSLARPKARGADQ